MKLRIIFFTLFVFFIVSKSYSQKSVEKKINISVINYLDRINQTIFLTKLEKEKLLNLKKEQSKKLRFVENKYKNHNKLSDEILKVNIEFSKSVIKEFGKQKGVEILEAAKVLKGSYSVDTGNKQ